MQVNYIRAFVEHHVIAPLTSFSHAIEKALFPPEFPLLDEAQDVTQKFSFDAYFGKAYVINIDSSTKKLETTRAHFEAIGMTNWERFSAVNGYQLADDYIIEDTAITFKDFYTRMPGRDERHKRAQAGCFLSHLYALKQARAEHLETVHIHEDDAVYAQNEHAARMLEGTMKELPENWDMLFLGFHHDVAPTPLSQHVVRVESGNCMHSYVVHQRCFDRLIGHLEQAITDRDDALLPVDEVFSEHFERKNYNVFCPRKLLCAQRDGLKSDITGNTNSDYSLPRKLVQRAYYTCIGPALNALGLRKYMIYKTAAKIGKLLNLY
ncbi:MAG: glycosyltransferase family 25 protein [Verrucomicrobia bacterium]|nr:glycosyltransferase family 25 protein [Verrucomicrobiota bacterium]